MTEQPMLMTRRLLLRPFEMADAPLVREYAGAYEVALNTLTMPHPYPEGAAEAWIAGHPARWTELTEAVWAITSRNDGALMGAIGLTINKAHHRAEMGYWLALPYWNQGYMTEAATAVLDVAFGGLGLRRVCACHFARNPASGRVMAKIGMTREGCLREHVERWAVPQDLVYYGILRQEWEQIQNREPGESE